LLGVEGVPALRGVSLKVRRGEFVAIYGTSGGGKTSLLNVMGTIDKPTKGHLTICSSRMCGLRYVIFTVLFLNRYWCENKGL